MTIEQIYNAVSAMFPTAYWLHIMESYGGTRAVHAWKAYICLPGGVCIDLSAATPVALCDAAKSRAEKIYGPKPEHVGGCV